ncbi:MAG: hypothetical protein WD266_10210 [Balneolales bacterium]
MKNNRVKDLAGPKLVAACLLSVVLVTGCMVHEASIRGAVDQAVGQAIEQEMGTILAGYTDVMLYQLAYTQAFFVGGFGIAPLDFEVGEGSTWRVRSADGSGSSSFMAERALLERYEDGSGWWFLKFHSDEAQPMEFEILLDSDLQAREMYLRDPENGEVRHHEFAYDNTRQQETEAGEEALEEAGYQTAHYHLEEGSDYLEGREAVTVGAGSFDTNRLLFSSEQMGDDAGQYEYRWWVTDDVPGCLVRFEYSEAGQEASLTGELTEIRRDYQPRFFNGEDDAGRR